MKPIEFDGQNTTIARNQPLPSHRGSFPQLIVTSCWALTWRERIAVLWNGVVWAQLMTYGSALQPSKLLATKPVLE